MPASLAPRRAGDRNVSVTQVVTWLEAAGQDAATSLITSRATCGAAGSSWDSTPAASRVPLSGAVATVTAAPSRPGSWASPASQAPHPATQESTCSGSTSAPPSGSHSKATVVGAQPPVVNDAERPAVGVQPLQQTPCRPAGQGAGTARRVQPTAARTP